MKITFLASRSDTAQAALSELTSRFGNHHRADEADVIVALGGDGFMLDVLHALPRGETPVYGMNRGTVGFLMNSYRLDELPERIAAAKPQRIHPLAFRAWDDTGAEHRARAFNEVSILRHGPQAANLRVLVNGTEMIENLVCDGALLATPAGSTAYNSSAHGPILPINANVLALTPIAAFRPRRWRGAVLPDAATVTFETLDPRKRPVLANADSRGFAGVLRCEVSLDRSQGSTLLFDPGHALEDRILREQFL